MKIFNNLLFIGFSLLAAACAISERERRNNSESVDLSESENSFDLINGLNNDRIYKLIDKNQLVYAFIECKDKESPDSIPSPYLSYHNKPLIDFLENGYNFPARLNPGPNGQLPPVAQLDHHCEVTIRLKSDYGGFQRFRPIFIAETDFSNIKANKPTQAALSKKLNFRYSDELEEKLETLPMLVKVGDISADKDIWRKVIGSNSKVKFHAFCQNNKKGKNYEFSSFSKEISFQDFLNEKNGIKLDYASQSSKARWIKNMKCLSWIAKDNVHLLIEKKYKSAQASGTMLIGNYISTDKLQVWIDYYKLVRHGNFLIYNKKLDKCYNYDYDLEISSIGACSLYDSAVFNINHICNGIMDCEKFNMDYKHDGKYLVVYKDKENGGYLVSVIHRAINTLELVGYEIASDLFKLKPEVPLSERFKLSNIVPIPESNKYSSVEQYSLEGYELVLETEVDLYVEPKPNRDWFPDTENSLCKYEKNPPTDIHPYGSYRECCFHYMPLDQQECETNSANWWESEFGSKK